MAARFGRHTAAATMLAMLASAVVVGSTQAASLNWSQPLELRSHRYVELADAAFDEDNVAVIWNEYRPIAVGVRTSGDAGATFGATHRVRNASEGQAALCEEDAFVVYSRDLGSGSTAIELATNRAGTGDYDTVAVAGGPGLREKPDVACSAGRVFVSWYETDGDGARLFFSSARRSDMIFGARRLAGIDSGEFPGGFRIAATNDSFYATFALADDQVYLERWLIGPGPEYRLTRRHRQIVATGNARRPSFGPKIGVDGSTVAIAYYKCQGIKVKVSHDGGRTWTSQVVTFPGCGWHADGGVSVDSVEINDGTIVLNWWSEGLDGQTSYISRSDDGFRTFIQEVLGSQRWRHDHVGFLATPGGVKLADAFTKSSVVRFRIQN